MKLKVNSHVSTGSNHVFPYVNSLDCVDKLGVQTCINWFRTCEITCLNWINSHVAVCEFTRFCGQIPS